MPANICHCAEEAVRRCPEGSLEEQVDVATHLNVWATIERLIKDSQIIKKACQSGQVQVHGAVYDIFTGDVKWLGQHHNLEQIVDMPLPLHRWKVSKYTRPCLNNSQELGSPGCCSETGPRKFQTALAKLQAGNRRFTESNWHTLVPETVHEPFAIIIGGAEMRVPIEKIFDADPGDLVVQQVIGSIAGHLGGNLFSSIEYAIVRFQPKLLLVLGGSHSPIIATALQQVHGADLPSPPTRTVVDCVMVSAMRAVDQVREEPAMTLARRDMQIQQLTVDFNVLYTIEQLLKSAVVRDAVTKHGLELHAGVLNETNGEVEFLGQHPMLHEIMAMHAKDSNAATAMGVVGGAQGRRSQLQRNSSQSMASCVSEAYEGQVIPVGQQSCQLVGVRIWPGEF
ncbi:unnamed protein product [Polarella glacialis]|uniref:carbonic anhydrase n=1 Tax=Polarella glacialis TaxID=89957 RepID=A0A813DJQ8_POLGL|nr:unnamed protein product [Polarella glacialis]